MLKKRWLVALGALGALSGSALAEAPGTALPSAQVRPIFDFISNRTLAHVDYQGGLFIQGGTAGFAKYVRFGRPASSWKFVLKLDGQKVALANTSAILQIPLTKDQAQHPRMVMRLKVGKPSSVKIHVGSQATKPIPLKAGWQVIDSDLPSGSLHEGENSIRLEFANKGLCPSALPECPVSAAAAIDFIRWGDAASSVQKPDAFLSELAPRYSSGSLRIPSQSALYYYVDTEAGALVAKGQGNGCDLKISLSNANNDATLFSDVKLDGTPVPLQFAGQGNSIRRLGLHAKGACKEMVLTQVQMVRALPAIASSQGAKPKNIIFWLSDDTRADKIKLWNPRSRVETPVLDAFSRQATRFEIAYSQGNESRVSHASLFTGMYPKQHNFISDKAVLSEKWTLIPEAVKPAGLYTIGHIANGYITQRWGFGDGWNVLNNHIHEGGGLKAEDLVSNVRDFLKKGPGKNQPFFFYIGSIDAHVSWRAHEPWISKYDKPNYQGPFVKGLMDPQLDQVVAGKISLTARDKERVIALYDSDISYTDQQFGELLKLLKETGHDQDTMIVFTSDHGEEFWEHGRIGHGQSLRSELIHVPLWIYYPPLFPKGKVIKEGVELVDLLPTITDALGVKTPELVQGESLIPLAQGLVGGYPRPAIASKYELAHTMRMGNYKIWVGGSGDMQLFDASTDMLEEKDISKQAIVPARFMADAISLWLAYQHQWKKSRWGVASNQLPAFAIDTEESPRLIAFESARSSP